MANLKGAATGALSGAASGAAIGSVVPGIGTAIGAIGGGLVGAIAGGSSGGDDTKPQLPPIVDPVTGAQIANAQHGVNSGLDQQQGFVNAVNAQNGLANQSQVYNQFQGIANGTGPNPAQAMLNQATGTNVANQAALMASQRGAGANAGLIARQAAQQGAGIQQNAAGQAATLQANQSLNALGAAGNIAGQQVGNQAQAISNLNQFQQGNQGQILQAASNYNNAVTGAQGNVNDANQKEAARNADFAGGLANGAGAAAVGIGGAFKGSPNTVSGGFNTSGGTSTVDLGNTGNAPANTINPGTIQAISVGGAAMAATGGMVGPSSFVGRHLSGKPQYAHGGQVDALVSPGERYLSPAAVKQVADGKKSAMSAGERIPGKANVAGNKNSYANDTVGKKLQEGGIVLPRSVTQSKDPGAAAAKFVQAILSKQGLK